MALKTMIANIAKARDNYEKAKAALGEDAQKAVAAEIAEVLPKGMRLQWTQYTPYFNDGDACTFGVRSAYVLPVAADEDVDEYEYGIEIDGYVIKRYENTIGGLQKDDLIRIEEVWRQLPEDLLESAFGDHVQVVVMPDGAWKVDKHRHD